MRHSEEKVEASSPNYRFACRVVAAMTVRDMTSSYWNSFRRVMGGAQAASQRYCSLGTIAGSTCMARRAGMIPATSTTSANMIATQPRTSDQYNVRESFHGLLLPSYCRTPSNCSVLCAAKYQLSSRVDARRTAPTRPPTRWCLLDPVPEAIKRRCRRN
jgi:hypothetical protein